MGKKKSPALVPFMVMVSRVVEYHLPIAAPTIEQAKEIADDLVAKGWADEYAEENDAHVDFANPADDDQKKAYKFLDEKTEEHRF